MKILNYTAPKRTDAWREGAWVDLWSVVHVLSGTLLGYGLYFLHVGVVVSGLLALLLLVMYEMWEMLVHIAETTTNRFMDVVIGMVGFSIVFYGACPHLSTSSIILLFGLTATANVVLSIFGWQASQKAAALQRRIQLRYERERMRLLKKEHQLSRKLHRK